MTPPDVNYSDDARDDLDAIFLYIVEMSGFSRTAQNYIERIMARCELIGTAPDSGIARPDFGPGIRQTPFERLVIVYDAQRDNVLILRIFSSAQDYETIMRDRP